jgi:co-chaperonin GroES (HSP10)
MSGLAQDNTPLLKDGGIRSAEGDEAHLLAMRPMRGRALLQVLDRNSSTIITPDGRPLDKKIHRGRVVSLGAPALSNGVEQPWGCAPGDEVLYVYAIALEKVRRFRGYVVCGQEEIQAVIEP